MDLHELETDHGPCLASFAIGSFESIGPLSQADFPHRHTFYEIFLVTRGRGAHVVDLRRSPLIPPLLGVIAPGQVHYWEDARDVDGWVLLFNEDFLLPYPEDGAVLHALSERALAAPGPAQFSDLSRLFTEMHREYVEAGEGFAGVLRAYLHILLVCAGRALRTSAGPSVQDPGLVGCFLRLIAGPGQGSRTLASYAHEIGISAGHLHDTVRQATGLTPGKLIRKQRLLEAKRLIASTDLTIRQVSDETGFADPAYFSRFFRRETGSSPGEFRRQVRGKHHDP